MNDRYLLMRNLDPPVFDWLQVSFSKEENRGSWNSCKMWTHSDIGEKGLPRDETKVAELISPDKQ